MIVQFATSKVLGDTKHNDLIAIFFGEHFISYGEVRAVEASNATVRLVINSLMVKVEQVAKIYSEICDSDTPFEIRGAGYKRDNQLERGTYDSPSCE